MGVERSASGPGMAELRVERVGSFLDLAVLADLAVGAALRARTGQGALMPTLTLTLQLLGPEEIEDVRVRAWAESLEGTVASARAAVVGAGGPLGSCLATFALAGAGATPGRPLPWEVDSPVPDEPEALGELSEEERTALAALDGHGALAGRVAAPEWDGTARGRLEAGPLVLNRAGAVQGGVLAGLACAAARRAAGRESARVAALHLAFLRPAPSGELRVAAEVLHAGRRATSLRAEVMAGAAVVATAMVALAAE
jgi:acyl-coenzyme A thioesterase PaaI-like protein